MCATVITASRASSLERESSSYNGVSCISSSVNHFFPLGNTNVAPSPHSTCGCSWRIHGNPKMICARIPSTTHASRFVVNPPACIHNRAFPCTLRGSPDTPRNMFDAVIEVQSTPASLATSRRIAEHCAPVSNVAIAVIGDPLTFTGYTSSNTFVVGHVSSCIMPSTAVRASSSLLCIDIREVAFPLVYGAWHSRSMCFPPHLQHPSFLRCIHKVVR